MFAFYILRAKIVVSMKCYLAVCMCAVNCLTLNTIVYKEFGKYGLWVYTIISFFVLCVVKVEFCIAWEIVTFFGVATPTQCVIRRKWPIVGFRTKLVVAYSGGA